MISTIKVPARERVIVALDVPDLGTMQAYLDRLGGAPRFYKIGLELFIAEGERAIDEVQKREGRVFLDLKLHDIPETVARAVTAAAKRQVEFLTVHTAGGYEMLHRAAEAANAAGNLKLLGVTVLTSLVDEDLRADNIAVGISEQVQSRARVAAKAGLAGLVCSPHETVAAHRAAPGLCLVVPGVRPAGAAKGDQKRVATPGEAVSGGADYLVIGRPLRDAADPAAAFAAVVGEVEAAVANR